MSIPPDPEEPSKNSPADILVRLGEWVGSLALSVPQVAPDDRQVEVEVVKEEDSVDQEKVLTVLRLQEMLASVKAGKDIDGETFKESRAVIYRWKDGSKHKTYALHIVGEVFSKQYEVSQEMDGLNQAISAYEDAAQNGPKVAAYLHDYGASLLQRFRRSGDVLDISQSISAFEQGLQLLETAHADKPKWLNDFGVALHDRFQCSGNLIDLRKSVSSLEEAIQLGGEGHKELPSILCNLGGSLFIRFLRVGDLNDLDRAITVEEEALEKAADGHPDRPAVLNNLGKAMTCRFQRFRNPLDLDRSITVLEDAMQLTADGHALRSSVLNNIGNAFLVRFENVGEIGDLTRGISVYEEALRLTPEGHPGKSIILNNLGSSIRKRFEVTEDINDLNKSVSFAEAAADLVPDEHPDKPSKLNNLSNTLYSRFEHLGDISDLNRSISVSEMVVRLTPVGHPGQAPRLNNLAVSLLLRYQQLGNIDDLDKSISLKEEGLHLTPDEHPDRASRLNSLANSVHNRFERSGDLSDLERSLVMYEGAVRLTPEGHPNRPSRLNNLGNSLQSRFEYLGNVVDLTRSILMAEESILLTPDNHPDAPLRLNNLGASVLRRFEQFGDLSDINRCISLQETAVALTPEGHTNKPSRMDALGVSLLARFRHFGDFDDLHKSVSILEMAMQLTPNKHYDKPPYSNHYGSSLLLRFERLGDLGDVNKAITVLEMAHNLTPDGNIHQVPVLNNLGICLIRRYERLKGLTDITRAVGILQDVVKLTPDGDPDKRSRLNNLANALMYRSEHLDNLEDLNASILRNTDAFHLTHDMHPERPSVLLNFGKSLLCRFDRLGEMSDAEAALRYYSEGALSATGSIWDKFRVSVSWGLLAQRLGRSPIPAYKITVQLLPQLAWPGLSVSDRHYHLSKVGEAVRLAAAAAIEIGEYAMALEWLEEGRSVVWSQLLQLRTPLDELHEKNPELASRFQSVLTGLEGVSHRQSFSSSSQGSATKSFNGRSDQSHILAHEREKLLNEIHALDGFDRFLLPKLFSQLVSAGRGGPVVIVNITQPRCDALVLLPDSESILHIPLPNFSYEDAERLSTSLRTLLRGKNYLRCDELLPEATRAMRPVAARGTENPENKFKAILSQLWTGIAKPVLDSLDISIPASTDDLPHVWWCLTGPLTFLPIHAAGIYDASGSSKLGHNLSDYVISSYTPTLSALLHSQGQTVTKLSTTKLLAVALPTESRLPGAQVEVDKISSCVAPEVAFSKLMNSEATVEDVKIAMEEYNWVHFACHGIQDTFNPTNSALKLAGGSRLTLTEITKLSLPHAELAVLSACQTATGAEELAEEAVHMSAGMLLAGYRGVIGTLWSIDDRVAPQVAEDVYKYLFQEGNADSSRAALALHLAMRQLRGRGSSFFSWVPFVHFGG